MYNICPDLCAAVVIDQGRLEITTAMNCAAPDDHSMYSGNKTRT